MNRQIDESINSLTILFEDSSILVVNKPSGIVVHPAPGHEEGAVTDFLLAHCPHIAGYSRPQGEKVGSLDRPGVVHRLDIETSGVMVLAKTEKAYLDLRRQFESHRTVEKTYLAVCHAKKGVPPRGTIDTPVGRPPLAAISHYEVLSRNGSLALVEFRIETGRMHQIRIHAASIGMPVVGDTVHGDRAKDARLRHRPGRLLLHAVELAFLHPVTRRRVVFAAPPPAELVYTG